jgi:DNA-binding NarL/FixJ family response regulator
MIRILVCDDRVQETRTAIDRISTASVEDGGEEVVVAAHPRTAQAAFKSVASTKFDIVLIDLFLPIKFVSDQPNPAAGPWLARAILQAHRTLRAPLVMWTTNVASTLEHRNQSRAFLHHGGTQITDKVDDPRAQRRTLEAALVGEKWQPPADDLTEAEREVLAHYAAGLSTEEIAARLFRAVKTIEANKTAIRRKLLPVPTPPGTGSGSGAVLAAASAAGSRVSWLPIEHLHDPSGPFTDIDKG